MPTEIYEAETDLEEIAQRTFPGDQFVRVPGVCVFSEHDTVDSQGQPQHYDRDALQQIVDCCNSRIRETGDFCPLAEGHTPDREQILAGAKNPDVLGFVGNFRLGRIGAKNSKYAVFADEWHFTDRHHEVTRKPRRSVEVWMNKDMGKRFFDPIVALGTETPRLDLGIKFARLQTGQRIEKYQAATAAFPAAGNTFVKGSGDDDKREETYEMPSKDIDPEKARKILKDGEIGGKPLTEAQKGMFGAAAGKEEYQAIGDLPMLADEELRQILDAFNQLDVVVWAREQMASQQAATEGEYQAAPEENGGELEPAPPVAAEPPEGPASEIPPPPTEPATPPTEVPAIPEEEEKMAKTYSKQDDKDVVRMSREERSAEREKYRKTEEAYESLKKEHYALKTKHNEIIRQACDSARSAKLDEMALRFAVDADEEKDRCLYSRGSKMDNANFDLHVATIERLAQPSPVGRGIPLGRLPSQTEPEDAEKYERAKDYAEEKRREGTPISWDAALHAIEKLETGNGKG